MSGTAGLLGWSWIFVSFIMSCIESRFNYYGITTKILEGMATVLVGILALFVMVDFPATASFLTPEERSFIVHKKSTYFD
jgi:hypothetical protein